MTWARSVNSRGSDSRNRRKLPSVAYICTVFILAIALNSQNVNQKGIGGRVGAGTGSMAQAQTTITTSYPTPYYALQDLPLPPSLILTATRFGCGVAVSADGSTVVALGMDTASMRQFALIYTGSAEDGYWLRHSPFFGDTILMDSGFLQATNNSYGYGTSCPVCISSDGSMFAMGGWMTSVTTAQTSDSSIIIAKRSTSSNSYQYLTRLYSGVGSSLTRRFANDMICTQDMSYIKVAEPATVDISSAVETRFVRNSTTSTPTWDVSGFVLFAPNTNQQRTLRMAMSGDEVFYVVKQVDSTVELYLVEDDSLVQTIDLVNITLSADILGLALDYHARILTFAVQGSVFPGETYLYAIERSAAAGDNFDPATVIALVDPSNSSYSSWGTGVSMAFMPNEAINALMVGMPGFPIKPTTSLYYPQTGAVSTWIPCTTITNYTRWTPGQVFVKPFATGIALADGFGCSTTSHSAWSASGNVLAVSAPMGSYSPATGRVLLFVDAFPLCPAAPVAVPITPTAPPPVKDQSLEIATFVILGLAAVAISVTLLIKCILGK
jgi:hypothetical protein